jgi:hypothetical protein
VGKIFVLVTQLLVVADASGQGIVPLCFSVQQFVSGKSENVN